MARTKQTARKVHGDFVGLTRCRFPAPRAPDGTPRRIRAEAELASTIQHLEPAPGYKYLEAGRRVENPDEILVCTHWVDEASLRAFLVSPGYAKYLESLGLSNAHETNTDHRPAISIAEVDSNFFPAWNIATIFTAAFAHSTEPEIRRLTRLTLDVPDEIHYPGRLGPARPGLGWIIDPELEDGRLVKKGMTLQKWAVLESYEKQLEVYRAMKQHAESREEQRLEVEKLNALWVDEATWDFGDCEEEDSDPEPDQEADLTERLGTMKVQS